MIYKNNKRYVLHRIYYVMLINGMHHCTVFSLWSHLNNKMNAKVLECHLANISSRAKVGSGSFFMHLVGGFFHTLSEDRPTVSCFDNHHYLFITLFMINYTMTCFLIIVWQTGV